MEGANAMLAQRMDFFGKRHRHPPVTTGSVYRRVASPNNTVETAQVLSIVKDVLGIAHVRFHMSIRQGHTDFVDEVRILNLETFASMYSERVEA